MTINEERKSTCIQESGNATAIKSLIQIYKCYKEDKVKLAVIEALGEAGGEHAVSTLTNMYSSLARIDMKLFIIKAIGRAGRIC